MWFKRKYVVYSHYKNLRWYFKSTNTNEFFMISLNIFDIPLILRGIYLLLPPFKVKHIKGNWN